MDRQRARVSRETRLLLGVVALSLASLWVLARLRFPEQPRSPNPVPPVLAQFAPPSPFEAIATSVGDLEAQLTPLLTRVSFGAASPATAATVRLGVPIDGSRRVVITPPGPLATQATPQLAALDRPSGLAVLPSEQSGASVPSAWTAPRVPTPRFLIAAEATREGISFRPVFIGAFMPTTDPRWSGEVWRLPASTAITDGALLFSDDGGFAGAFVARSTDRLLVPAELLRRKADAIRATGIAERGEPGFAVQDLTPALAAAARADHGLIVTRVDPEGPAAGHLRPLDVIDTLWGQPVLASEQWASEMDRVLAGHTIEIGGRRATGDAFAVTITAGPPAVRRAAAPLGAALRLRRGVGTEVVRVEPGGAAAHAGLQPGDLVTALGGRESPTPAQITSAFGTAEDAWPLALAVTRGSQHLALALEKSW